MVLKQRLALLYADPVRVAQQSLMSPEIGKAVNSRTSGISGRD